MLCVNCGATLVDFRGKAICRRCGLFEACCEGECGREIDESAAGLLASPPSRESGRGD